MKVGLAQAEPAPVPPTTTRTTRTPARTRRKRTGVLFAARRLDSQVNKYFYVAEFLRVNKGLGIRHVFFFEKDGTERFLDIVT